MTSNIYDRQDFFDVYSTVIDRSNSHREDDVLWKRLSPVIPKDINGMNILDFGSGSGWFARWAVDNGANSVLAIDGASKMIAKAHELSGDNEAYKSKIEYRVEDLDILPLVFSEKAPYDLVFTSLVLHYLVNLKEVVEQIYAAMKPGSLFVVNLEHPIYTAPTTPRIVADAESGQDYWNLNSYGKEGERVVNWLAPGLRKQHRTFTTFFNIFLSTGFELTYFDECLPTDEELEQGKMDASYQMRPIFAILGLRKPAA